MSISASSGAVPHRVAGARGNPPAGTSRAKGVKRNMLSNISFLVTSFFSRLQLRREEGQGLVEYALIIALVAIVVIGALSFLETGIGSELSKVAGDL